MSSNKNVTKTKVKKAKSSDDFVRYTKLIVPTRMRSAYWKYFGFPATEDNTIITRKKIVCILCKTQIIYNRNTTNLRTHLKSKHKDVLADTDNEDCETLPAKTKTKKKSNKNKGYVIYEGVDDQHAAIENITDNDSMQISLNQTLETDETNTTHNIAVIFPNSNGEEYEYKYSVLTENSGEQDFIDAIIDYAISDLQLPNIVEQQGFQRFISLLQPHHELPTKQQLLDEMLKKVDYYKHAILDSISKNNVDSFSLSVEEWKTASGIIYVSFYVFHQSSNSVKLLSNMLSSIPCTGIETVEHWSTIIDKLFTDWTISSNSVRAIIGAFENPELKRCFERKHLPIIPCFLFVLQNVCQKVYEHISSILEKCRLIISLVYQSNNKDILELTDQEFNEIDTGTFAHDYTDAWISTYNMLKSFVFRKSTITSFLNECANKFTENIILNDEDWNKIEETVLVLDPLKFIVTTIGEERTSLVSLVTPIIWQIMNSHLEEKADDSIFMQNLKCEMKKEFTDYYSVKAINDILQVSTTLDPRFKTFLEDNEQINMDSTICELLKNLVDNDGIRYPEPVDRITKTERKPNSRQSGMNMILGNIRTNKSLMPSAERYRLELIQYNSETIATLDDCPLQWWTHMANKTPNLLRLAQRYNCIPAISIPVEQVSYENRINYITKRGSLSTELVDVMLFMHANHRMFPHDI